ncbi:uncharacterized protein LOC114057325 [Empidonax traillii]|uniref:uncharacterized protein LOC114057325 n=1 Tax=Empidonax traillii TaxID=164674 RepID=UPI000FFD273F|nr:uncharacterized protein LOC114057325 [Empidonax traillii]
MDAIKITRGRTRRSQGAGDALGGPSPAAAGGPESSPRAKELAAGAPAPSRRRHREGRGGSGPGGRQSPHIPVRSKARRRGPKFGLRTGERRRGERRDGRRAGLPPPGRERHRCSAVQVQPSRTAYPPSPTNALLGCQICPSVCLDIFSYPEEQDCDTHERSLEKQALLSRGHQALDKFGIEVKKRRKCSTMCHQITKDSTVLINL